MMTVQIVCNCCKALVEVKDCQVVAHDRAGSPCPRGGQRYIPSRRGRPVSPGVELLCRIDLPQPLPLSGGREISGFELFSVNRKEAAAVAANN